MRKESEGIKRERLRLKKYYKKESLTEWLGTKIDLSHKWIEDGPNQKARQIIRGGIYMCHLGDNVGDENGKHRPVLVVSNELINTTSGKVVIVPVSTTLTKKVIFDKKTKKVIQVLDSPRYKSHYFLRKRKYDFLSEDSATITEDVRTVSKVRLGTHRGTIDGPDLQKVLRCLNWVTEM